MPSRTDLPEGICCGLSRSTSQRPLPQQGIKPGTRHDPAFVQVAAHHGEGGRIAEESRVDYVVDRVDTTGTVWLGLTVGCARCHEHKYDPIAQKEYFQFRAFFEPHDVRIDRVPGQADPKKDGLPRVYDAKLDAPRSA